MATHLFHRHCGCLFLLLLASLLCHAPAGRAAPIPCGPKAQTARDFEALCLRYNRRSLVDGYRRFGVHSPVWDRSAVRYLETVAALPGATAPSSPELGNLLRQGNSLVAQGCADPLVLHLHGTFLADSGKAAEAYAFAQRAVAGHKKGRYPKARTARAMAQRIRLAAAGRRAPEKQQAQWAAEMVRALAASTTDGSYSRGEQRIFLSIFDHLDNKHWPALRAALERHRGVDAYILKVVQGRDEVRQAWAARGTGWADTVTGAGWRGFSQHLAVARRLLPEAWKMHPEYPEAPTAMIDIAMAGEAGRETPRLWFDRAVAAQMDWMPAYSAYRWSLRPRWGGSCDEIYRFGVECLRTRRFDTGVPNQLFTALGDVTNEVHGRKKYWLRPETYGHVKEACEGYARTQWDGSRAWWETMQAASAWCCERPDEAKRLLVKLGKRVDDRVFTCAYRVSPQAARAEIYALGPPHGATIRRADALATRGRHAEALKLFQGIRPKTAGDPASHYVDRRIAETRDDRAFAAGQWINLRPGADLAGWQNVAGKWTVMPDGGIRGESSKDGLLLVCDRSFGKRFELRGKAKYVSGHRTYFNACVLWHFVGFGKGSSEMDCLKLSLPKRTAALLQGVGWDRGDIRPAPVRDQNSFSILVRDGVVTTDVNGAPVHRMTKVPRKNAGEATGRVGIGGWYWYSGTTLEFSNLQIRRLK